MSTTPPGDTPEPDAPDAGKTSAPAERPPGVPDDRSSNAGEEDPGSADDTTLAPGAPSP